MVPAQIGKFSENFATHIIGQVNTPSPFHERVIRQRLMILRQTGVLQRVGIIDLCDSPSL